MSFKDSTPAHQTSPALRAANSPSIAQQMAHSQLMQAKAVKAKLEKTIPAHTEFIDRLRKVGNAARPSEQGDVLRLILEVVQVQAKVYADQLEVIRDDMQVQLDGVNQGIKQMESPVVRV